MRGRKPQPTRLKVLRGNPGRRKLNEREPKVEASVPDPPDFLEGEALAKWADLCETLGDLGVLTHVDRDVLTLYCETWAEWKWATIQMRTAGRLSQTPNGHIQQSPLVTMRSKATKQLLVLEAELGMTPSSRSRVQTVSTPKKRDKSKWADLKAV